jgi:hypothetical protein
MHYQVVLVNEKASTNCNCGQPNTDTKTTITSEIEKECNKWAAQGYVLVSAYDKGATTTVASNCGCYAGSQASVNGAVLVFAKRLQ